MKQKKGQVILESILLLLILTGLTTFIMKQTMQDGQWMKKIIEAPGNHIRGMSLSGSWVKCENPPVSSVPTAGGCSLAMDAHPNQRNNTLQTMGDDSK